jgi:hypothetical protein
LISWSSGRDRISSSAGKFAARITINQHSNRPIISRASIRRGL